MSSQARTEDEVTILRFFDDWAKSDAHILADYFQSPESLRWMPVRSAGGMTTPIKRPRNRPCSLSFRRNRRRAKPL
jgi:hypothetical protein